MKKMTGLAPFALAIMLFSGSAGAADYTASVEPIASWTGFYGAVGGGIRWGEFDIKSKKSKKCDYGHDIKSMIGCEEPCYETVSKSDGGDCEPDPCAYSTKTSDSECDYAVRSLDEYDYESPFATKKFSDDDKGFFGTVQLGYNHEIASPLVVGIFASADFGQKLKVSVDDEPDSSMPTGTSLIFPYGGSDKTWAASVGNIFTVGARAGIAPSERVMLYVLAGWSWTKGKASYSQECADLSFFCSELEGSNSKTLDGLTLGAGGEVRVTDKFSIGLEFRHTDFGSIKVNTDDGGLDPLFTSFHGSSSVDTSTDIVVNSVRALAILHF